MRDIKLHPDELALTPNPSPTGSGSAPARGRGSHVTQLRNCQQNAARFIRSKNMPLQAGAMQDRGRYFLDRSAGRIDDRYLLALHERECFVNFVAAIIE